MQPSRTDIIRLVTHYNLSKDDRDVLHLLYQPIIGIKATSLYLTLHTISSYKETINTQDLCDILGNPLQEFIQTRNYLEAIGLVSIYLADDVVLYDILHPLGAEQFMKDGSLAAYLEQEIGERLFHDVTSLFHDEPIDKTAFKNVTTSFDEIYGTIKEPKTEQRANYRQKQRGTIQIEHAFDFDFFLEGLSKNFVDKRRITQSIKDKIIRLSYIYNLNEHMMQRVFMDSVNRDRSIDEDMLSQSAKRWHSFSSSDYKLDTELQDIEIHDDTTYDLAHIKKLCKNASPSELIGYASGVGPSSSELSTIEKMYEQFDASKELLNFLAMYAFINNDNSLPSFNYIEKIFVTWKRNEVETIEDAIQSIEDFYKQRESYSKKSPVKDDIESDWLDDYIKNF